MGKNKGIPKINVPLSVFIIVVLLYFASFLIVKRQGMISDEGFHGVQIGYFLNGDFRQIEKLTVIPTYHLIIAAVMTLFRCSDLEFARMISFLGAIIVPGLFYLLAGRTNYEDRWRRTLLFLVFPFAFPLYFYLYTDIWALGPVLAALYLILQEKPTGASFSGLFSVLLRQTNIIWAGYSLLLDFDPRRVKKVSDAAKWFFVKNWSYVLLFAGFLVFAFLNGSVSAGDRTKQHETVNLVNAWFYLASFGILLWPLAVAPIIASRKGCRYWVGILGTAGLVCLFAIIFKNTNHPYNSPNMQFWIHNRVLYWFADDALGRCMAIFGIVSAVIIVWENRLSSANRWLFHGVSVLSLIVMPIVSFRYLIPPLAIFLAFYKTVNPRYEWYLFMWWFGLSALLFYQIVLRATFL